MSRMRFAVALASAVALAYISATGHTSLAAADSEQDSEYQSFRIPSHRWFSWTANVGGSGRRASLNEVGFAQREGLLNGNASTTIAWFLDSDELLHRLSVTVAVGGGRTHSERTFSDTLGLRKSELTGTSGNERAAINAGVRTYPFDFPLGLDLSVYGDGTLSQGRQRQESENHAFDFVARNRSREQTDVSEFIVGASATVGLGRVRDASVVYRTQLLEQRLRANGNLSGPLSSETRRKIAALFYAEPTFTVPHDRPAKFFWREIERILREDGALESGSLDAYAVFRVLEPAIEGKSPIRAVGFFVGPYGAVEDRQGLSRTNYRSEYVVTQGDSILDEFISTNSNRNFSHQAYTTVGARAQYHRPIGMQWQVDVSSALSYIDQLRLMRIGSGGTASYLIADRWFADVSVGHLWSRQHYDRPNRRDDWRLFYRGSVSYFLEDSWRLGLTWASDETHDSDRVARNAQFSLGLTYHIAGWLEVPGVVEPVRMMRY